MLKTVLTINKCKVFHNDRLVTLKQVQELAVNSFHLKEKEVALIGTQKPCQKCGETFTIGEQETKLARCSAKGDLKTELELYEGDIVHFVKVQDIATPLEALPLPEQAIALGVECLHVHYCPSCVQHNHLETDNYLPTNAKHIIQHNHQG